MYTFLDLLMILRVEQSELSSMLNAKGWKHLEEFTSDQVFELLMMRSINLNAEHRRLTEQFNQSLVDYRAGEKAKAKEEEIQRMNQQAAESEDVRHNVYLDLVGKQEDSYLKRHAQVAEKALELGYEEPIVLAMLNEHTPKNPSFTGTKAEWDLEVKNLSKMVFKSARLNVFKRSPQGIEILKKHQQQKRRIDQQQSNGQSY